MFNLENAVGSRKFMQALDAPGKTKKTLNTNKVTTSFLVSLCTSISYIPFSCPTAFFRFKAASIIIGILGCAVTASAVTATEIAGDAIKGKRVYARCMGCHSPERHRTGPMHCGLIGRKAGTAGGFDYSPAMQRSDIVWSDKTLDQFLSAPLKFMPGTAMAIGGISNNADRQNLISYLASLDGDDQCQ